MKGTPSFSVLLILSAFVSLGFLVSATAQENPFAAEPTSEELRMQMVQNVRESAGITSERFLAPLRSVPREWFTDDQYIDLAYSDTYLPGPGGAVIPSPSLIASVFEKTNPRNTASVLIIGENTGYTAALFSRLVSRVTCIEFRTVLYERFQSIYQNLGYDNITLITSTTVPEFLAEAPFDLVFVHGAVTRLPEEIIAKSKTSGTVVFPLALPSGFQILCVLKRNGSTFSLEAFQSGFFRVLRFF